jgi:N-acetylneuraminate synthase/N,N'-diacetyllegionaminate synthase
MQRVFVIAEAGVNHNGDIALARQLVHIAREAGADAVKFQTFRAEDLVTLDAPAAAYQTRNAGATRQFDMLRRLELPDSWHAELKAYADGLGTEFFSTPFSERAVDLLVDTGVRRLKMPSGELTNKPLLQHAARTGLPIILSTGMGTLSEVERAVEWIRTARPEGFDNASGMPLCVLHCTSNYPAAPEALNLRAIQTLASALALPVGYSDHSEGVGAALAAVALGAVVIEKHITFDKSAPGPDHLASMTGDEFTAYVRAVRELERMLGDGIKAPHPSELDTLAVARRSVVAARALTAGHVLTRSDLAVRRPAGGLEPAELEAMVGRTLREPLASGQALAWSQVSEPQ